MTTDTIAVLQTAFMFSLDGESSVKATASFYGDQPHGEIKVNKTRRRGAIVEDDFPTLLRTIADYMEQEGFEDLEGVANALGEIER